MSIISEIQANLKSPKSQTNAFGKYKYRSCEDIVEAVKPLLAVHGCNLNITDEIISVCDRVYVKATASVMMDDKVISQATACAREALSKKGMDEAQVTGAASSYARKYALNGLFAIDDTKDADTMDNTQPQIAPKPINQAHVDGVYNMLKECVDADTDEIDYKRMITGWSRISSDEQIAVFAKFDKQKPEGGTKLYRTIIKDCLAQKEGDDFNPNDKYIWV